LVSIAAGGTTPAAARAIVVAATAAADVAVAANGRVAVAAAIVASRPVAAAAASRDAVAIVVVNLLAVVGVDATPTVASMGARGSTAAANGGYPGVRVGAATAAASPGAAVSLDVVASPVVDASLGVDAVAVAGRGMAVVRAPGRMARPATRASAA
jgi:hypothetical protein